jgi:hypothetical protein
VETDDNIQKLNLFMLRILAPRSRLTENLRNKTNRSSIDSFSKSFESDKVVGADISSSLVVGKEERVCSSLCVVRLLAGVVIGG